MGTATIIFDFDGTLHDSMHIYRTALRRGYQVLVDAGQAPPRDLPESVMAANIGLTAKEAWGIMCPEIPWSVAKAGAERVGQVMDELIENGTARLYPGVAGMLQRLADAGHVPVFLSNCRNAYRDASRAAFGLDRWFAGRYYTAEQFGGAPKEVIFETIRQDVGGPYIVVGDRDKDGMLARAHGLPFIGCAYGYAAPGELDGADYVAMRPADIADGVDIILKAQCGRHLRVDGRRGASGDGEEA